MVNVLSHVIVAYGLKYLVKRFLLDSVWKLWVEYLGQAWQKGERTKKTTCTRNEYSLVLNKEFGSRFPKGYWRLQKTPEEVRRKYVN